MTYWKEESVANIKLTVRLSFAAGEEQVFSAEHQRLMLDAELEEGQVLPPYRLESRTAPSEPTLVQSRSFARLG